MSPSSGKSRRRTGLRCPVTAAGWRWPCTRVHVCACVCTRVGVPLPMAELPPPAGGCGDPGALPKPGAFRGLCSPPSPSRSPKVTGQGGDAPGWVSPSPLARPPRRHPSLCTCHVMVWLPVKPVAPGRALPSPPALPDRCRGCQVRPRGPCRRDARRVPELDAAPCCSAGRGLYP